MYTAPTIAMFIAMFVRDFPYGTDPNDCVTNNDITNAFNMVDQKINPALWGNQNSYNVGYLLLAAHYLVTALRASSQGLNGQYSWVQNSKSVGAVTESFTVPQRMIDNPDLMMLTKTTYGAQYLELILPLLCGQILSVCGGVLQ